MKKIITFLVCMLALCIGAGAIDTVYVSDSGKYDGRTAERPTNSFDDAVNALTDGGTVVIVDTYTFDNSYYEPFHNGEITVTGGKIIFNHVDYSRYYLSGPTKFENVTFTYGPENTRKTGVIISRFNALTLGDGIKSSDIGFYVVGGYQHPIMDGDNMTSADIQKNLDSSITINSGTYTLIAGFSRGSGSVAYTGTSHITVNGGTVKSLYGASVNGSYSGNTEIQINGGSIGALYTGGDSTRRLNGNATVKINGGTVTSLMINNVMGHADIYYLSGSVGTVSKSVAESLREFVTDGTTSLITRRGINVSEIYELFDTATYEDGSAVTGAADLASATYTVLDKVPAESSATGARIYVANVGNGDGLTPETAISDIKQAYSMLAGVDGTIVLINEIDLSSANFYEPEHDSKIVITSYDGERYFDGGINTGKSRRFYFSGDTTIENTKLNYQSTALYVGRFNNITFGAGLETVGNGDLYALAGHQFGTEDPVSETVNGSVTIKSGNFYCVLGYTRGAGGTYTFKGTQTVNLLGGTVKRVYGGVVQSNVSDDVVINIDGATVTDFIQVGGDQSNHSNTATVNMKSGYVEQLDLRNVLVSTTVNWTGGEIKSFACDNCIYNGERNETAYAAANEYKDATYTLNYKNVTPTAEALGFFTSVNKIAPTVISLTIGQTVGYVNGVEKALDAAPIIRESRTMLPVRFVAENLGAEVLWNGETSTATVKTADTTIEITIGAKEAKVNSEAVTLDAPAFIENSRTYLPVRFVAENLGATVTWDGATSTATLTK
ncbi:MAG: copper amine oxidase N-terminal domain-containing protein [Clostridia bacterium]|nr:copper amine oxidase N-terminal domain-containing protein [Clostridia bacterium]